MTLADRRNNSLYAHGRRPVPKAEFDASRTWLEDAVLPEFVNLAFGGALPYGQLPDAFDRPPGPSRTGR